jgi:hypothetical protein
VSVSRVRTRGVLLAAGFAVAALLLWGGYVSHWRWTGFHRHATLWDWLEVLMLPVAIGVAPLWARHGRRLDRKTKAVVALFTASFVTLVVVGYAQNLRWTGFPGNRLWDWLELLVLPLVVTTLPVWAELAPPPTWFRVVGPTALVVFSALVVAGYTLDWGWTGFQGNTFFDWLHLLIAPLLLPLVVVPAAGSWLAKKVEQESA